MTTLLDIFPHILPLYVERRLHADILAALDELLELLGPGDGVQDDQPDPRFLLGLGEHAFIHEFLRAEGALV